MVDGSNDQIGERLRQAELLVAGGTDEGFEAARKILEGISTAGLPQGWGQKWTNLMGKCRAGLCRKAPKVDAARAKEWLNKFWNIESLTDKKMAPFLDKLGREPAEILRALHQDIVGTLRSWLGHLVVKTAGDPAELKKFIKAIKGISLYAGDLQSELTQLDEELFRIEFQPVAAQIRKALENWSIAESRDLFKAIHPKAPANFPELEQIKDDIYQTSREKDKIKGLLKGLPNQQPDGLVELDSPILIDYLSLLEKIHPTYLSSKPSPEVPGPGGERTTPPIPEAWREIILQEVDKCVAWVEAFLRKKAAAKATLDEVPAFMGRYDKLPATTLYPRIEAKEEWFHRALDSFQDSIRGKVAKADSTDALKHIRVENAGPSYVQPEFIAEKIRCLNSEIEGIEAAWEAMKAGKEFKEPRLSLLSLPDSFRKKIPDYRDMLEKVRRARQSIGGASPAEAMVMQNKLLQAMRLAEKILQGCPWHDQARELKKEAEIRLNRLKLDGAIEHWKSEEFYRHLNSMSEPEELYQNLADKKSGLERVAALAVQSNLRGWRQFGEWWKKWQVALEQLPGILPSALEKAINDIESERKMKWSNELSRLLEGRPDQVTCEEVTESLKPVLADPKFSKFQKQFQVKASTERTREYVKKEEWQSASQELEYLTDLPEGELEAARLGAIMEVEKAKAEGVKVLARILRDRWYQVVNAMNNKAYATLLEAIKQAWKQNEADALCQLKDVLCLVLETRDDTLGPPLDRDQDQNLELRSWKEWLEIEQAISEGGSVATIKRLIPYMKKHRNEPTLRRRLAKLVSIWQGQNQTIMIAWAYRAFREWDLLPGVHDPIEDLADESREAATEIRDWLNRRLVLTREDLHPWHDELQERLELLTRQAEDWRKFRDMVNLQTLDDGKRSEDLTIQPPEEFRQAKDLLKTIIDVIADIRQLEAQDLRQKEPRDLLDNAHITVMKKLDTIPQEKILLEILASLRLLTQATSLGIRILEAAKICGSLENQHLDQKFVFTKLKDRLRQLIDIFEKAEARGRPMWHKVSEEYCRSVYSHAGILGPPVNPPDLAGLPREMDRLEEQEKELQRSLQQLKKQQPIVPDGGEFEPERYPEYLGLFPQERPGAKRIEALFGRIARVEPMATILRASLGYIPGEWLREWVKINLFSVRG